MGASAVATYIFKEKIQAAIFFIGVYSIVAFEKIYNKFSKKSTEPAESEPTEN